MAFTGLWSEKLTPGILSKNIDGDRSTTMWGLLTNGDGKFHHSSHFKQECSVYIITDLKTMVQNNHYQFDDQHAGIAFGSNTGRDTTIHADVDISVEGATFYYISFNTVTLEYDFTKETHSTGGTTVSTAEQKFRDEWVMFQLKARRYRKISDLRLQSQTPISGVTFRPRGAMQPSTIVSAESGTLISVQPFMAWCKSHEFNMLKRSRDTVMTIINDRIERVFLGSQRHFCAKKKAFIAPWNYCQENKDQWDYVDTFETLEKNDSAC